MKINLLKTKDLLMWLFLFGHLILISIGVMAKILHLSFWYPVLLSGIICLSLSWLIIFLEIFMNDIYNRRFWLIWLFILPTISPAVYMIKREKLLRYGELEELTGGREKLDLKFKIFD